MKFAFSTVACPAWDFATIAARAKEYGFPGVEIRGFLNEPARTAADLFKESAGSVRAMFKDAGIEIASLASSIAMTRDRRKNDALSADLRRFIDTAAELGCPVVKVLDTAARSGQSHAQNAMALGEWLAGHGDYAADRNVTLAVENALTFRRASELWMVLEGAGHPAIAAAWNVFHAARAGEAPGVSIPTLNSRVVLATVKDAKLTAEGVSPANLGEGDVPAQKLLIRLKGIGYKGYVCYECDKAFAPSLPEPEQSLPHALQKLKEWTKPQVEPKPKKEIPKKEPAAAPAAAKA